MHRLRTISLTASLLVFLLPSVGDAGTIPDCCGAPLVFHFGGTSRISDLHTPDADSPHTTANVSGMGPSCLGDALEMTVEVGAVGVEASADVRLNIISDITTDNALVLFPDEADAMKRTAGVQGFSISVALDNGDFDGGGFDTADTAMTLNPLWGDVGFAGGAGSGPLTPFPSLFISAAVVDPTANAGQEGIILAFVNCLNGCSVAEFGQFPQVGTETMVRLLIKTDGSAGVPDGGTTACVRYQEGLVAQAGSVPAESVVTIAGDSFATCNRDQVKFSVNFIVAEVTPFLRCDPNDDGKTDLADPIYIINDLFRDVDATCTESLDCNGSGGAGLDDVSYGLNFMFMGGPPPPAPFDGCAADPAVDCASHDSCAP